MGSSLRGRHCCTTFCCTAVGGLVDRFLAAVCSCRVSAASWDSFSSFFLPLYRLRACIVQRTTSTMYYSNSMILLFCVPEILPCSLIRSTTTEFRISQYNRTHIFCFLPREFFIFSWLSSIPHYSYTVYHYNFIHTWYIYTGTWYMRTAVHVIPWYHTTYYLLPGIYLVCV